MGFNLQVNLCLFLNLRFLRRGSYHSQNEHQIYGSVTPAFHKFFDLQHTARDCVVFSQFSCLVFVGICSHPMQKLWMHKNLIFRESDFQSSEIDHFFFSTCPTKRFPKISAHRNAKKIFFYSKRHSIFKLRHHLFTVGGILGFFPIYFYCLR